MWSRGLLLLTVAPLAALHVLPRSAALGRAGASCSHGGATWVTMQFGAEGGDEGAGAASEWLSGDAGGAVDDADGDGSTAWGSGSWSEETSDGEAPAADWLSSVTSPAPITRSRPIETIKVGRVQTPYKRRNGYHVEVAVQHSSAEESIHRLWFGFEVLDDVAKHGGRRDRYDVDVERFGEEVVRYLQQHGVDLADPDWGMDDDAVPFSTQHLPVRTLYHYYPDLAEHLSHVCLKDEGYAGEPEVAPAMSGDDFDVPMVLDRPFIATDEPLTPSIDALKEAVERGFGPFDGEVASEVAEEVEAS